MTSLSLKDKKKLLLKDIENFKLEHSTYIEKLEDCEHKNSSGQISGIEINIRTLEKDIKSTNTRISTLKNNIDVLKKQIESLKQSIAKIEIEIKILNEEKIKLQEELSIEKDKNKEAKSEYDKVTEINKNLLKDKVNIENKIKSVEESIKNKNEEIAKILATIEDIKNNQIPKLNTEYTEIEKEKSKILDKYNEQLKIKDKHKNLLDEEKKLYNILNINNQKILSFEKIKKSFGSVIIRRFYNMILIYKPNAPTTFIDGYIYLKENCMIPKNISFLHIKNLKTLKNQERDFNLKNYSYVNYNILINKGQTNNINFNNYNNSKNYINLRYSDKHNTVEFKFDNNFTYIYRPYTFYEVYEYKQINYNYKFKLTGSFGKYYGSLDIVINNKDVEYTFFQNSEIPFEYNQKLNILIGDEVEFKINSEQKPRNYKNKLVSNTGILKFQGGYLSNNYIMDDNNDYQSICPNSVLNEVTFLYSPNFGLIPKTIVEIFELKDKLNVLYASLIFYTTNLNNFKYIKKDGKPSDYIIITFNDTIINIDDSYPSIGKYENLQNGILTFKGGDDLKTVYFKNKPIFEKGKTEKSYNFTIDGLIEV